MPPTFLLYVGAVVAAVVAPIIAVVGIAMSLSGRHKQLGRRVLISGTIGGTIVVVIWLAVVVVLSSVEKVGGLFALFIFGAGFTAGVLALGAWRIGRRVLGLPTQSLAHPSLKVRHVRMPRD